MTYKGKAIEIIGSKTIFGRETLWVHILEDDSFIHLLREDLDHEDKATSGIAEIRYIAIAARIKEEIAQKRLLAPYESSLIPLPHQILVLEKVMKATQNRFLLADEVGMGKTIEAGLILKELKLRSEVKRILLIVSKSAMLQWQSEMQEHFKESFRIYDSELISSLSRTFSKIEAEEELNFWRQHNQIIVSTDALKPIEVRQGWSQERVDEYNKYRIEAVVNADFDMIIIDEAHKMGGTTAQVSRYQLAEALCNVVPNVLLLSATPHRGKPDHFRRVLKLVDADAFAGEGMPSIQEIEPYVIRSEKRFAVDYDGNKLFNQRQTLCCNIELDADKHALQLALYEHVTEYVRISFGSAKRKGRSAIGLVMVMFQKLAGSSTAAILSATRTRLWRLQNEEDADSIDNYDNEEDYSEEFQDFNMLDYSVESTPESQTEEDILTALIAEAEICINTEMDAKASTLINKIYELQSVEHNQNLKILVFTEFRTTQEYLYKLLTNAGMTCSYINGSMNLEERRRALIRFKENANIMIATDAAGESLNMQFCHIVVNYDIPWNPMALEQRIGRVDRIGQQSPVIAINLMTNNSIDTRVYQIIVEKLDTILEQLGIDKTSDVLDSTIDVKKTNHLYLQSLLDPRRFEFAGESWLLDIQKKLLNYKSTEGALPNIPENEINQQSAAEIKYSPLPVWLEELMDLYTRCNKGSYDKRLTGVTKYAINEKTLTAVFDPSKAIDNPQAEHITLQCDIIKRLLGNIDGKVQNEIPVIHSVFNDETAGYFSIWEIIAKNPYDSKITYSAQFVSDKGKVYPAYANDIWNKLVQESDHFISIENAVPNPENNSLIIDNLFAIFHKMESNIKQGLQDKADKKLKALDYAEQRASRIGIENIRKSKQRKIREERQYWETVFSRNSSVVPDVKHVITVRIDG